MPYSTRKFPWRSFIHPDVYNVEVVNDPLNWSTTYAVGNVAVIGDLTRHVTAVAPQIELPIRVVKGDHDGILDASAHALILQSPFAVAACRRGEDVLRIFAGQTHCLLQGPEGENVVADLEKTLFKWFAQSGSIL